MADFTGKSVIVTGAASGIGRATAAAFVAAGARVLACDRAPVDLDGVATMAMDAGDEADVAAAVERACAEHGGLDIFFANAGISGGYIGGLFDTDAATWAEVLRVNLIGPFLAVKHAAPRMAARGGGAIICTASVAGLRSGAGPAPYSASKAGVINLVQVAAQQLAGTGVRVNAVLPGLIETGMTRPIYDDARSRGREETIGKLNPLRRGGEPEEIAAAVLFLASDAASYVNGAALPAILAAAEAQDGVLRAEVPDGWRQGRTSYGGLVAALALESVRRAATDLAPLRSAQIAFAGPVESLAEARATPLRQGRTAAFWSADVSSPIGFGTRATFVFAGARPSHLAIAGERAAIDRLPDAAPSFPFPPAFARNFDYRFAQARPDVPRADLACWVRLHEREGLDPFVELLCVGDALPPAAIMVATTVGPLSSMTWQLDFHMPAPTTRDGWWLLRSTAIAAADGLTAQRMGIWNADGEPVLSATQTVALFF